MKIIQKSVPLPIHPRLASLCPDECPLFLDIETTGLSPDRAPVYLFGCCYPEGDTWRFIQWFAEHPRDEKQLLASVNDFIRRFSLLVHFNGDHFDLPYLHRRAARYGILDSFLDLPSLDLYKKIRPCKTFLGLPNCKLKTIEAFLGLNREDEYNGGQLIEVYQNYVRRPDSRLERLLLLHNEEDILGMPELLPVLSYADFLSGAFHVQELLETEDTLDARTFHFRLDLDFPRSILFVEDGWEGLLRGDILRFTAPKFSGELKYFLPDYKNYYYLPAEDTAIHKSVAAYVDKNFRKKATAKTGYVKKEGTFLKIPAPLGERVFRSEYGGNCYLEQNDTSFSATEFWQQYLQRLVCLLH